MVNRQATVYQLLETVKLLPLYTATDLTHLTIVEELLVSNGVPLIEVAFRSQLAAAAIKQLARSGRLTVGAGTVRTIEEAKLAVANGAKFIVSPAIVPEVIDYCLAEAIPVFPGTATPGDIQRAIDYGLKVVKFFPADIYGGINAIKALSGPFYDVAFLPTGGVDKTNVKEYLEHKQVIAVGGSFIISEAAIEKDRAEVNQALAQLVQLVEES